MPFEAYSVTFPGGSDAERELSELGTSKAVSPESGDCVLTFPYWLDGEVERVADGAEPTTRGQTSGEPRGSSEPVDTPASFQVATRTQRYRFRVVVPYLDVALVDEAEQPRAGSALRAARWRRPPGGERRG